ncbi:MAG: hypothetical protein JO326_05170, partial [Acetobacteraceae bacterium]|nr:hypothetical protein [Acetobacteraceae bacterium]
MRCIGCGSAAIPERPARPAQGYRRFRCRGCGKPWNERTGITPDRVTTDGRGSYLRAIRTELGKPMRHRSRHNQHVPAADRS